VDSQRVLHAELELAIRDVLLLIREPIHDGKRDDVLALMHDPGQRELTGCALVLRCDLGDPFDQIQVPLEVLACETRVMATEIILWEVLGARDRAGEKASPERAVGDKADTELAQR